MATVELDNGEKAILAELLKQMIGADPFRCRRALGHCGAILAKRHGRSVTRHPGQPARLLLLALLLARKRERRR